MQHPRLAVLALEKRYATPWQRLKTMWRKFAADSLSWRGLREVSAVGLERLKGK